MEDQVRVLERPESIDAPKIIEIRKKIEGFLGVKLPVDLPISSSDEPKFLEQLQIFELIIERPPFYMPHKAVIANLGMILAVTSITEERCQGHFPDRPVVPLIRLCEVMAQTGLALAAAHSDNRFAPVANRAGESNAAAKDFIDAPVTLLSRVDLEKDQEDRRKYHGEGRIYVDGELAGTLGNIEYTIIPRRAIFRKHMH